MEYNSSNAVIQLCCCLFLLILKSYHTAQVIMIIPVLELLSKLRHHSPPRTVYNESRLAALEPLLCFIWLCFHLAARSATAFLSVRGRAGSYAKFPCAVSTRDMRRGRSNDILGTDE